MRPFFPPPELCHWGFRDKALFVFPPFKTFLPWALLKEIEPVFQFRKKPHLYWIDVCRSNKMIYWTLLQCYSVSSGLSYSTQHYHFSCLYFLGYICAVTRRSLFPIVPFSSNKCSLFLGWPQCVYVFSPSQSLCTCLQQWGEAGKKNPRLELLCLLGNMVSLSD